MKYKYLSLIALIPLLILSSTTPAFAAEKIEKIYVFPCTHADVGFDKPPSGIEEDQIKYLENATIIANARPEFYWMIETSRLMDSYLRADKPTDNLIKYLQEGRIGVNTAYTSSHTAIHGTEEIFRLLYHTKSFEHKYNFKSEVAIINDNPGFTWALPTVLAKSGVKYLIAGTNTSLGGRLNIPESHNPFYWQGPDGSKVLVWISHESYLEGYFKWHLNVYDMMVNTVPDEVRKLESAGYDKDSLLMIFGTGDHGAPERFLEVMDNINKWNKENKSPEIVIADPATFFKHIEEKYKDSIPTYSGDFSGLWDVNKRFSPVANSLRNWSRDHVNVVEFLSSLNSMYSGTKYPSQGIEEIYRNLLFNSDHGAGAGTTWPGLLSVDEVNKSNEENYRFTKNAYDFTSKLLEDSLKDFQKLFTAENDNTIVVFNPIPVKRSDLVSVDVKNYPDLPKDNSTKSVTIKDTVTGETVDGSISSEGILMFIANDVPPMGYKKFEILSTEPDNTQIENAKDQIENEYYRITVNLETGEIVSILDKELNKEIIKEGSELPFNGLLGVYHNAYSGFGRTPGDPSHLLKSENMDIKIEKDNKTQTIAISYRDFPRASAKITLHAGLKRIYIENVLDQSKFPEVPNQDHSIDYLFAFPFNIEKENMEIRYDSPAGLINPETDYMPGATVGNLITQHALMVRDKADDFTVILSNRESYINMWNGGAMLTNRYAPRDATILALGMAKQDFGETKDKGLYKFKTLEPVDTSLRTFTYAITTTGEKEQVVSKTKAEGLSFNVPLQAFYMNKTSKGAFKDLEGSIVSVNNTKDEKSKNVFLTAFKQAEDWVERKNKNCEYYVLRLKEYEGTKTEVNINTMFKVKNAWIASALEEPESELKVEGGKNIPLTVDPRDTVTILMEVEKPGSSFTSTATGKAIIALGILLAVAAIGFGVVAARKKAEK